MRRQKETRGEETNLLRLPPTLPPHHLRVSDLGLQEVLLGGGQQQTFRIQRTNHIVPDGTPLPVVPAHPSRYVLLYHLTDTGGRKQGEERKQGRRRRDEMRREEKREESKQGRGEEREEKRTEGKERKGEESK